MTGVTLTIPARPGPLTLRYPKWIPGHHGPEGPIGKVANLRMTAAGKPLPWRRDAVDLHAFHCEVPAGADAVAVQFDYLSSQGSDAYEVSLGVAVSPQIAIINWNALLLYPAGRGIGEITCAARLRMPKGWKQGGALAVARAQDGLREFAPVSLETLVDSPVFIGPHYRAVPLAPGVTPPHQIDLFAENAAGLELEPDALDRMTRLVTEAGALFGARHYERFHFLLALSDRLPMFGLEHHRCSVNTVRERALRKDAEPPSRRWAAYLLPHEYVHSWVGKHRRPAGMVTPDFQQPQQTELLWVYEGLAQYLGYVLAVRCGLMTADEFREEISSTAAALEHQPGRAWRSLADVATAYPQAGASPSGWSAVARPGQDFYDEGMLLWLEVDALIRRRSGHQHSLDAFCRRFFGGAGGRATVKPYTVDHVIADLNAVCPYDWRGFFAARVLAANAPAPLGGIVGSGWRLVYRDTPPAARRAAPFLDLRYSLGLTITSAGALSGVRPGSVAEKAGLRSGMRLAAVNGRRYSPAVLRDALKAAKTEKKGFDLLLEDGETFKTIRLDYQDGERYPILERDPAKPDLLEGILTPT